MEILIGIIAGIGTSLGIGGGTILILFLTLFLGINQPIAQAINLFCFIPASVISILYNWKKGNIHIKNCYFILIFGIFGALIGSYISQIINVQSLTKFFGYFLLIVVAYEIYDFFKFIKSE